MKSVLAVLIAVIALSAGIYVGGPDVHAQEPEPEPEVVATATVQMTVSSSFGNFAKGTVYGDCGSLTLNLYNDTGGYLHWQTIMTSIRGPIFSASYNGAAHNLDTGGGHYVSDSTRWHFSSSWQSDRPVYTGPGVIFGEILAAELTTVSGITCVAAGYPTDVVWVSN